MPVQTQIALTSHLQVEQGAHILYLYTDNEAYLENVISFIETGLKLEQRVVYIDTPSNWSQISNRLNAKFPTWLKSVLYLDNHEFYRAYEDFHFDRVLQNFKDAVDGFLSDDATVRMWGQVAWLNDEDVSTKVSEFEHTCDVTASDLGFLTVCAYDAHQVPAAGQLALMRSHPYLMTDKELVRSNLYSGNPASTSPRSLPSLRVQSTLESEMDLYKRKLDFVHVISHEVRNPLTVIRAYATLLSESEDDEAKLRKLKTIQDYSAVIDHEISHIITTEQTLTTDSLWHKRLVKPREALDSVLAIMETKGRTQNVRLVSHVDIPMSLTCVSNLTSLRLVFSNIISNAIKYSHEGSMVTVTCRAVDNFLEFVVVDTGVGMTEEQQERLRMFRKYEKQNEDKSGQGIGLFMVKTLVDALQGDIEIQSRIGEGTRVAVRLPL